MNTQPRGNPNDDAPPHNRSGTLPSGTLMATNTTGEPKPIYTLDQARIELAHQQCRAKGHDLDVLESRTVGGDHTPIGVRCDRCHRTWDITTGTGGINLGEPTNPPNLNGTR